MDVLLLTTPEQFGFDNPTVELNPKKVAQWVAQLPLLNLAASVADLLATLEALNHQPMADRDRMRLLELYRSAGDAIFTSFDTNLLRQLPISSGHRQQLKEDVERLLRMFADGYKIVVMHAHRDRRDPRSDPSVRLALYRALEHTGQALVHAMRTYRPTPPFAWLELHQLYRYAEHHQIVEQALETAPKSTPVTIAGLYKRLMLFAIADPPSLQEGEAFLLYRLLEPLVPFCSIVAGDVRRLGAGCYVFDLCADSAPRPVTQLAADAELEAPRALDLRALPPALQARLAQRTPARRGSVDDDARLLSALLARVRTAPERRAPRQLSGRIAHVAVGVTAIHRLLGVAARGAQQIAAEAEEWEVENESQQGFLLRRVGEEGPEVAVGEVLGLFETDQSKNTVRRTCVLVRWMRSRRDGLDAGVEIMVGGPQAVLCANLEESPAEAARCLFLPSVAALGLSATLLAPKKLYARGRRLQLQVGRNSMVVEAGHLVMDTACIDRFEFTFAAQGPDGT